MLQEVISTPSSIGGGPNTERRLLSEDDLTRMSEAEYMNSEQLAFFKSRLLAVAGILEAKVRVTTTELAATSIGADPADRASAEEEHSLAISGRVRDASQLLEIHGALRRIEGGDFGWCEQTGEMIGIRRLLACPTTVLSFEAQKRVEDNQRRYRM